MTLDGFKLTMPDGAVFRATEGVTITHSTQPLYPVDGLRTFVALYNTFLDNGGQPGRADSNMSGVFLGFGAGAHTITVEFPGGWEGSTDTWGDSASGDSAVSKLQELNEAITNTKMDSTNPGEFEAGEYSASGKFSLIPVAFGEMELSFNPSDQSSVFSGRLVLRDAVDLSQNVDSLNRGETSTGPEGTGSSGVELR